jgi:predicted nucleic acid-binding protein
MGRYEANLFVAPQIWRFWRSCDRSTFRYRLKTGAAKECGEIRNYLAGLGQPIGPNDLMIATIAKVNGLTVVTHNTAEFSRVPGLMVEDWQMP